MQTLPTWAGRSSFSYAGSIKDGTDIYYGTGQHTKVTARQYTDLLRHFAGKTVDIGQRRCGKLPEGSLGEWVNENIVRRSLVSYLGPILVEKGYAEHAGGPYIKFR